MKKDGRESITSDDIEIAAQELNHGELLPIAPLPENPLSKQKLSIGDVI